jgi:hypothetical protein
MRVIMREGKKRQIREIGRTIGLPVQRIIRIRIGALQLGTLKPGEWRNLTPAEVKALKGGLTITDKRIQKPAPHPLKKSIKRAIKLKNKHYDIQ